MKFMFTVLFVFANVLCLFAEDFNAPVNIVFDKSRNVHYVSNMGGQGVADGSILVINNDGSKTKLVNDYLYDPMGMVQVGNKLFVADNKQIIRIDLNSGAIEDRVTLTQTGFLTDICTDGSAYLYITDMIGNKIYKVSLFDNNIFETLDTKGTLYTPMGLEFDSENNRLVVCSFQQNAPISEVNLSNLNIGILAFTNLSYMYGITRDNDGNYYVSVWGDVPPALRSGKVYKFDKYFSKASELFSSGHDSPSGIYYDIQNNQLCVPNLRTNYIEYIDINQKLPAPILYFPVQNHMELGQLVKFQWLEVNGAESYIIQISKDPNFISVDFSDVAFQVYAYMDSLQTSTDYYWRVRAASTARAGNWSEVRSFSTAERSYYPPQQITPAHKEMYATIRPNFIWHSSISGIYELEVHDAADCSIDPLVRVYNLRDTSYQIKFDLSESSTYYWRVRTYSGYVSSEWSPVRSFQTYTFNYPQPKLYKPDNKAKDISIRPEFSWEPNPAGQYGVEINTQPDFLGLDVFEIEGLLTNHFKLPIDLQENNKYYWRVKAYRGDTVAWSQQRYFNTENLASVIDSHFENISVYPNPATNYLNFDLPELLLSSVSYDIISINGKYIQIENNSLNSGPNKIDISTLQNGAYWLRLKSESGLVNLIPFTVSK